MNIESIQSVMGSPFPEIVAPSLIPGNQAAAQTAGFGNLVADGLTEVNRQLLVEQTDLQKLAVGDVQNLHEVMIRMEESRLSFELMMQVRNRVLESYQDVMKMQI